MPDRRPDQLPLDLAHPPAQGRADLVVGEANRAAVALVDRWPDWPVPVALVHGGAGAGKTHLLRAWAERARPAVLDGAGLARLADGGFADDPPPAWAIDDADRLIAGDAAAQGALLHLINHARDAGRTLLLTGTLAPGRWPVDRVDLSSRLKAGLAVALAPPDDALLTGVLVKLLADRRYEIDARLIRYAVARMERSLAAAGRLVARIDRLSLARQRPVTLDIVRAALQGIEGPD